jgi:type I restriction enzyme S subunit
MDIKKGYKNTELGMIPEIWRVKTLNDVSKITRLAGYEYSTVWKEDENGEIIALRGFNIGKNKIIEREFVRISNELSLKLKRSRLYRGNVIYPCVGTIGNALVIEENDKYHIQQNIAKITPDEDELNPYFLAHYLMSSFGISEIKKFNGSSSQPNILVGSLRNYSILLPTKAEQTAIASALSNIDELISQTEKLIEKKKAIKQGVMQQLFAEKNKWVRKKIKEFGFDISDGNYSAKYPKSSEFKSSGIPFIRANNIKKMTVVDDDMRYISEELHNELRKGHLKKGDILITNRGDIGQTAIVPDTFIGANINAQIVRINTCGKLNSLYLFHFLRLNSTQNHIQNIQTGSALKQLPVNKLLDIEIAYPEIDVQILIGETLYTIDTEILSIESIKLKYQNIKHGMMQTLLTGKRRLL